MTHIGLHISLPLNVDSEPRVPNKVTSGISKYILDALGLTTAPKKVGIFAVLNCHEESDFFHALALPLVKVGPMRFVRDPERRLQLLQTAHISAHTLQEIFIEDKPIESFSFGRRNLAFIIPKDSPQKVIRVYPPEFWDARAGILQGLEYGGRRKSWHACLELRVRNSRGNERQIILILGLDVKLQREYKLYDRFLARPWCILLDFRGDRTLEQLYQNKSEIHQRRSYGHCKHRGVHIHLNRYHPDFGRARKGRICPDFVDVMGAKMCVVDIDTDNFFSLGGPREGLGRLLKN